MSGPDLPARFRHHHDARYVRRHELPALNLRTAFAARGDGVTDDSIAVRAWLTEIESTKRPGYAPPGTYLCGDVDVTLGNATVRGAGQFATVFKATPGATRALDLRGSVGCTFEDFSVDGAGTAEVAFDIAHPTVGASTQNHSLRQRFYGATDRGADWANNGDTTLTATGGAHLPGDIPAGACVVSWINPGGNSVLIAPNLTTGGDAQAPTLRMAFQQAVISGGATHGIEIAEGYVSRNLKLDGVYLYASAGGACLNAPFTVGHLDKVALDGCLLNVRESDQSFFDGEYFTAIVDTASEYVSTVPTTEAQPLAFGANFFHAFSPPGLMLMLLGSINRNDAAGQWVANWNDSGPGLNIKPVYRQFVVNAGTGWTLNYDTLGAYATADRPVSTKNVGTMIYDTTLSKPIWWDGSTWRDAVGTAV